jgi:hypothetical protein
MSYASLRLLSENGRVLAGGHSPKAARKVDEVLLDARPVTSPSGGWPDDRSGSGTCAAGRLASANTSPARVLVRRRRARARARRRPHRRPSSVRWCRSTGIPLKRGGARHAWTENPASSVSPSNVTPNPKRSKPFDVRRHALTRLRFRRRVLLLSRQDRTRSPIRAPASDNLSSLPSEAREPVRCCSPTKAAVSGPP